MASGRVSAASSVASIRGSHQRQRAPGQDGTYGDMDAVGFAVGLYRYRHTDLGRRGEVLLDYRVDEVACSLCLGIRPVISGIRATSSSDRVLLAGVAVGKSAIPVGRLTTASPAAE